MKKCSLLVLLATLSVLAATRFDLKQLQGAWWSDFSNPTADFAIQGNQVWLDQDSQYHPCRVEGDLLIFDLGKDLGVVKQRILSLKGDELILEHLETRQKVALTRAK